MTFSVSSVYEESSQILDLFKHIKEVVDSTEMTDSIQIKLQKMMQKKYEDEMKYPNEIYIEKLNDHWLRQRYNSNRYSNFLKFKSTKDSVDIISPDKSKIVWSGLLKKDSCAYNIEIDRTKSRSIQGYDCHFIRLEEFSGDEGFLETMGTTIYEMWVTESINIPLYILIKHDSVADGFFPLDVKIYTSRTHNSYSTYTLKSIEYH